jgi:N6-adenosine-specific RNA methylase IME4
VSTRYRTIVADPPWDHSDGSVDCNTTGFGRTRTATDAPVKTRLPYPAMSLDEIRALPIGELAEPDAHLYLWTTNRYLRDVWSVAEAWGFRGVNVIVWCKPFMAGFVGGGAWQSNVEFCLFARRGKLPTHGRAQGRWYEWPRRRGAPVPLGERRDSMHSAKPEAFLDLVEQVSPGPYAELFARRARLGWSYPIGDQSLEGVAA